MNENAYDNDPAEEQFGGATGLGREAKIGVCVIALLAIVFVVVVVVRLAGTGAAEKTTVATSTANAAQKTPGPAGKIGETTGHRRTKTSGDAAPTIVSAKAAPINPARSRSEKPDRWQITSSRTGAKRYGSSDASSSVPEPPDPPRPDRYDRYASYPSINRETDVSTPYRDVDDNDASANRYGRMVDRDDASGYASVTAPTTPLPAYREHRHYGSTQATSSRPDPSYDRAGDPYATPTMQVGQYDDRGFRADPSNRGYYGDPGRPASASLYGNPPPRRDDGKYEVQPNDSYWTISEKLYGAGAYFKALARHNSGADRQDDQLQPGTLILAPTVAELEKSYPDLCPKPEHRDAMLSQGRNRTTAVGASGGYRSRRTYTVVEGDTLFDIARYELGKASRWAEIYDLNRDVLGKDFHYLTPGTRLAMPENSQSDVIAEPPGSMYRR